MLALDEESKDQQSDSFILGAHECLVESLIAVETTGLKWLTSQQDTVVHTARLLAWLKIQEVI